MPRAKSGANKVTLLICERDEGATGLDTIMESRGAGIGRLYIQAYDGRRSSQVSQGPEFYGIAENWSGNWFLDLIDRKATILSRSNGGLCGSSVCGPKIGSLRGFYSNKSGV
ncbi:hypothetical protein BGAL_0259g00180 [Botrytis galanthina]|uniref:Uncharacterized protein n=1 Tax=Botrytis galanthina TaxID=278940 RepID=A0A4S8QSR0_9HELO|nr:hypothetical protein BGAL_0259g00180 [Botrytis galanthina]